MLTQITKIIVVATVFLWVLWDIFVIYLDGRDASISQFIREIAREEPIVPFFVALVCAHWFWNT